MAKKPRKKSIDQSIAEKPNNSRRNTDTLGPRGFGYAMEKAFWKNQGKLAKQITRHRYFITE